MGYLQNIELSKEYFRRCSDRKAVGLSFIHSHWLALHGTRIRRQSLRVVGRKEKELEVVLHFITHYINRTKQQPAEEFSIASSHPTCSSETIKLLTAMCAEAQTYDDRPTEVTEKASVRFAIR